MVVVVVFEVVASMVSVGELGLWSDAVGILGRCCGGWRNALVLWSESEER